MKPLLRLLSLVMLLVAAPAAAQFSDTYSFIKAIKDKDANKAIELAEKPGNTIINARDADTGEGGIHITTRRTDLPWVGLMIKDGANVNLKDREGNTALILATIARWTEGVNLFLRVKAQPDIQNRLGETALLKAVQVRDQQIVEMLLKAGADPDLTDNSGTSARTAAARDPRAASIAKLFEVVPVKKTRIMQGPTI
jgi:ankyrin repeat protein